MKAREGIERRGFLARAAASLAALGVLPGLSSATSRESSASAVQGAWDMTWLDRLSGKHKQVFDFQDPSDLRAIRNWLDAHETVYGLKGSQVSAVIGITRGAFTANASDDLYRKYPLGELWKTEDPATGKPALRNIYLEGGKTPKDQAATVRALQARGVIFWQCNNALHGIAGMIAEAVKRPEAEVYDSLKAGLNPGVIVVPAHTMLLGLCQERGCSYQFI